MKRLTHPNRFALLSFLLPALLSVANAHAENEFRDPEDGAFDISNYLLNHKGFLPVPVVITEPAIGYGGGAMLMFFSESIAEAAQQSQNPNVIAPPNITGVGGAMTENGTWFAGLFHFHTWDNDRYRYLGALAKTNLVTDYYGLGQQPHSYELDGTLLIQQLLFKVGESHWYIGPRYTYLDSNTQFTGSYASQIGGLNTERKIGKAGFIIDYDSRDNMFFPNSGSYAEIEAQIARPALGSSQSFETYAARGYTWLPVAKDWNLALRLEGRTSDGAVPFYAEPSISLRGLSRIRYQDKNTFTSEVEGRWTFTPRWSLLAFGGMGRAWGRESFNEVDNAWGAGTGFRYLIARKLGLAVGIDIAKSKDDKAIYFQVGSAWR